MIRRHDEAELPHGRQLPLHRQLQGQQMPSPNQSGDVNEKRSERAETYGAVWVPGTDDGLGAADVRDEVAADLRVLHLERHVQLRAAVPLLPHASAA
jgi:hypothetical protein